VLNELIKFFRSPNVRFFCEKYNPKIKFMAIIFQLLKLQKNKIISPARFWQTIFNNNFADAK
jgi:hypothetical protein